MRRSVSLIGTLVLVVAACSGTASPTATSLPATSAPAVTPTPVTPAPTATHIALSAAATFDGKTCTYAGPTVIPRDAEMSFKLTNTPAALKGSRGAGLYVVPVVDGTTWQQIRADMAPSRKANDVPNWAYLPDVGVMEAVILPPNDAAAGNALTVTMKRDLYFIMCVLPPDEGEWTFPAVLLQTMGS